MKNLKVKPQNTNRKLHTFATSLIYNSVCLVPKNRNLRFFKKIDQPCGKKKKL